jgi:hypothetical protein
MLGVFAVAAALNDDDAEVRGYARRALSTETG